MSALPDVSRAAVFHGVGQGLTLENIPVPQPKGSEAIVRLRCTTICGSDLHTFYGRRPSPVPSILGHEMVGEIVDIGPAGVKDFGGRPLALGDRVTWSVVWSCGECFYCRRGLRTKCERLLKYGHERIIPGRALIGGLAEHCHLLQGTAIFNVPQDLPDTVAGPANCATATVAAVFRNAGPCRDQSVVIHGAGMLGLTACAMAAADGAAELIVLEPDAERRALASRFGATAVLDPTVPDEEVRRRILDLTHNRGTDLGMEFSGCPEAMELGIRLLREGGRFVMAGATFPSRPIQLAGEQLVRRMLRITGVYNYQPEDLETALAFLAANQRRYPFAELVGKVFALDEANAAFAYAEHHRSPRIAVMARSLCE